jgi:hypothetical protein
MADSQEDLGFLDSLPHVVDSGDQPSAAPTAGTIAPTGEKLAASNEPATLGFDPNQVKAQPAVQKSGATLVVPGQEANAQLPPPPAPAVSKPTAIPGISESDLGDIQAANPDQDLNQIMRESAGANAVLNAAVPLYPQLRAEGLVKTGQAKNFQEAMQMVNEADDAGETYAPVQTAIGKFTGMVAGGMLGMEGGAAAEAGMKMAATKLGAEGAISKAMTSAGKWFGPQTEAQVGKFITSETYKSIPEKLATLTAMSLEGGAMSVSQDRPDTWEKAVESFEKGASIAGGLGIAAEGASVFGKQMAQNYAEKSAKVNPFSIASASTGEGKGVSALSPLKEAASIGYNEGRVLLNEEKNISQRVARLPEFVKNTLDTHINDLNIEKKQIISELQGTKLEVGPIYESTYGDLDRLMKFAKTPEAVGAVRQARAVLQSVEDRSALQYQKAVKSVEQDPFLGPKATSKFENKKALGLNDIVEADRTIDQVQKMLYKDNAWKNAAPSELRATMSRFSRRMTDLTNAADESGQLGKVNNVIHNFLNAQEESSFATTDSAAGVNLYKAMSTRPNDPTVDRQKNLFSVYFDEKKAGQKGAKGMSIEVMNDPSLGTRVRAVKNLIDAEVSPATKDYWLLQKVKSQYGAVLNNRVVPYASMLPKGSSISAANKLGAFMQSPAGKGTTFGLKALGHGAATRAPSMLGLTKPAPIEDDSNESLKQLLGK